MKHIQAVEKFVAQFNQPGLVLVRFPTDDSLIKHYPDTFNVLYENEHFGENERNTLRIIRDGAIKEGKTHVQSIVWHPNWRELADREADVVLNTRYIDGQLYVEVTKWRHVGGAPTLKAIPIEEI